MALLWFASEFAYLKIPGWIYIIQAAINTVVLVGVFTAEHNPYFYNSMKILNDGMYQRINVSGGIIWKMHYIHMAAVLLTIQICCGVRYRQSTATQKKRILYIAAGNGIFALELILKGLGVFGSYNPVVCAMTITMFCMMMAMVKYGYFGSLHAAVDNAFNHGDEGLLVLSNENTIIFVNARMNAMYPGIREGERISKYPDIIEVLKKEDHMLEWGEEIYELRTESIIEHEEKSGMMLWFINQTQQLKQMEELRTANEIKQNILIQISHKLRTPMNAMLGMNEMILRESKEEQVLEYAKETEKAGEQMLALIEKAIYEAEKATGEEISAHSVSASCSIIPTLKKIIIVELCFAKSLNFSFGGIGVLPSILVRITVWETPGKVYSFFKAATGNGLCHRVRQPALGLPGGNGPPRRSRQ